MGVAGRAALKRGVAWNAEAERIRIRVRLVDRHALVRNGLQAALACLRSRPGLLLAPRTA